METLIALPDELHPDYAIETVKCFLCDHDFIEGEEPWLIFEKRVQCDGQQESPLASILSSALGRELDENTAHSKLLCDSCNATVLEFETIVQRFYEMRLRILTEYNKTAKRNDLETIAIEINGVLQDPEDDDMLLSKSVSESQSNDDQNLVIVVPKIDEDGVSENVPIAIVKIPQGEMDEVVDANDVVVNEQGDNPEAELVQEPSQFNFESLTDSNLKGDDLQFSYDDHDKVADNLIDVDDVEVDDGIIYEIIDHNSQMDKVDEGSVDSQYMESYSSSSNNNTADMIYSRVVEELNEGEEVTVEQSQQQQQKRQSARVPRQLKETQPPMYEQQGNVYACLLCPTKQEYDPKSFTDHMRTVHNYRFYTCDLCGSGFSRRQDLNDHMDDHHGNNDQGHFECETCQRVFNNYRLFRIHKRMHYTTAKQFECSECHKKYGSKNLLDEHMNMHTGMRPYKCTHCPKDFASKYTLHAHLKIHSERQRPYQCDVCNKAFLNQQNLTQHRKLHSGVKSFICEVCNKAFGTQHNLDVHKIVHTGNKPFLCRTCGKAFARRAEIKDHERIHTGERPFKCDICGMAFAQRSNLTSHKKSTHFNEKQHKCDQCERSFKRRRLLEYHIQSAHTGERPHKCEICFASFVYPEHHKKHMRIHLGIKPYACEVCGKQFNSRDNRNAHRFIHSEKKPYECLECGAGFMRKPLLLAHMKHTKHSNDTIIVNQPQIDVSHDMLVLSNSNDDALVEEVGNSSQSQEEEEEETEVDEDMVESYVMLQRAESILAAVDNVDDPSDGITRVKDEIGDVKYLQFEELDGDGHQTLTWVDIGDKTS